jgi:OOP family OmpA-OmpF porin
VRALRLPTPSIRRGQYGFSHGNNKYLTVGLNYAFSTPPAPVPVGVVTPPAPPVAAVIETPAPVAPPPPPPARFEKVTMAATELFAFNSAILSSPQPKLDEIAAALLAAPSINNVDITGYTDRLGSEKYNHSLSLHRAEAVLSYLSGKGVEASRLVAHGKGEQDPVAADCKQHKRAELVACLAPNRRVEVEQITIERQVR